MIHSDPEWDSREEESKGQGATAPEVAVPAFTRARADNSQTAVALWLLVVQAKFLDFTTGGLPSSWI